MRDYDKFMKAFDEFPLRVRKDASRLERLVYSRVHNLWTTSANLNMHEAFKRVYTELYPELRKLSPEARDFADKVHQEYQKLMEDYETLGRPTSARDDEAANNYFLRYQALSDKLRKYVVEHHEIFESTAVAESE